MRLCAFVSLCLACLVGCDDGPGPLRPDAGRIIETGQQAYEMPLPGANTFACATCHALSEPAADGFRRPGHPIGDAANRPTYKNTQLTEFRDAVNTCVVEWMGGIAFTADNPIWILLRDYLQAEAGTGTSPAIMIEQVDPPADAALGGGDPRAGQTFFNGACAICHGENAVGTERAPELLGNDLFPPEIAQRIRTSGPEDSAVYPGLTDGRMPFWGADRLSETELLDVLAFVVELQAVSADAGVPPVPDAGPPTPDAGPPVPCDSTHARVGATATLVERFHDVGGTVTVVDDCTIRIDNFTYDATGIDAQVYGAIDGNFGEGFSLSDDLIRPTPYAGETLTFRLPAGRTLDDMNSISIWCVPARANFGDGTFDR